MRKYIFLLFIGLSAMMFTSCKKDYTCTCTVTTGGTTTVAHTYLTGKVKKNDAKKYCDEVQASVPASAIPTGTTYNCSL
ncbi:MAG: hypothetical protein JWQ38_3353 [Flavipsychrobacter sp.]|nr:hypothetical protein [Flavipsychrobacter sp.]